MKEIVIGGRVGSGKTTTLIHMAIIRSMIQNIPCVFISNEMSASCMSRLFDLVSGELSFDLEQHRKAAIHFYEFSGIDKVSSLKEYNLFLDGVYATEELESEPLKTIRENASTAYRTVQIQRKMGL